MPLVLIIDGAVTYDRALWTQAALHFGIGHFGVDANDPDVQKGQTASLASAAKSYVLGGLAAPKLTFFECAPRTFCNEPWDSCSS